jgi:hypothetical protein
MKIGIYSSVPQSGKSTVSKVFQENGFLRVSFAEPVKNSLYVVLEALEIKDAQDYLWGDKKDKGIPGLGITGGMLMSKYATFMRNDIDVDIWLNAGKKFVTSVGSRKNWVCDDLRNENEFAYFDYTIHVINPNKGKRHKRFKESEGNLDKYQFSFTIINDGTEDDLRQKALEVLQEIKK